MTPGELIKFFKEHMTVETEMTTDHSGCEILKTTIFMTYKEEKHEICSDTATILYPRNDY